MKSIWNKKSWNKKSLTKTGVPSKTLQKRSFCIKFETKNAKHFETKTKIIFLFLSGKVSSLKQKMFYIFCQVSSFFVRLFLSGQVSARIFVKILINIFSGLVKIFKLLAMSEDNVCNVIYFFFNTLGCFLMLIL